VLKILFGKGNGRPVMEQQHLHEESVLNFLKIIFKHKTLLVIGIIISGASSYFFQSNSTLFLNKAIFEFEVTNEDKNLTEKLCESVGAKFKFFNFYLSKQTTDRLNAELIRLGQDKKIFFDITTPVFVSAVEENCPFFEVQVKFKTRYSSANRELTERLLEPILPRLKSYMEIQISDNLLQQALLGERALTAHLLTLGKMTIGHEATEKQQNIIKKIIENRKHELALFLNQKPSHIGSYNQISIKSATANNLRGSPMVIFCVGVFLSFIVSLLLEAYLRQNKQLRPNQN
jgi:hypothetical protein